MYILLGGGDALCFWNPVLWCFGIVHRWRAIAGESREAIGGFVNKEMVKSDMCLETAVWKMEWRREGYVEGCGSVFSTIVLTGGQEGVTKSRRLRGGDECKKRCSQVLLTDLPGTTHCFPRSTCWMLTVRQALFSVVFEVTWLCQHVGESLIYSISQPLSQIELDRLQPIKEISMSNRALIWILVSLVSCAMPNT